MKKIYMIFFKKLVEIFRQFIINLIFDKSINPIKIRITVTKIVYINKSDEIINLIITIIE